MLRRISVTAIIVLVSGCGVLPEGLSGNTLRASQSPTANVSTGIPAPGPTFEDAVPVPGHTQSQPHYVPVTQSQAEAIARQFFSAAPEAAATSEAGTIAWAITNLGYKNPTNLDAATEIFVVKVADPQHMILNPMSNGDQKTGGSKGGMAVVEAATGVVLFATM